MIRGYYSSASGLLAQQMRQDLIANNLANVNTTGFRRQSPGFTSFKKVLDDELVPPTTEGPGAVKNMPEPFILSPYAITDSTPGAIRQTGNPTNLALHGESAFFSINTPAGIAYTRNGSFSLNADQQLVTAEGYSVLGENGPITVNGANWQITKAGEVVVNGVVADRLRLAEITDLSGAERIGSSLWRTPSATPVAPNTFVGVEQGAVEGSNVNAIAEMVAMLTTTRTFEANQRCLQVADHTVERAVNDIARV